MRKFLVLALVVSMMFLLGACTVKNASITGGTISDVTLEPLKRGEYEVLQTASGEGCVSVILGIFKEPSGTTSADYKGVGGLDPARQLRMAFGMGSPWDESRAMAVHQALESVPDADMLVAPRFIDSGTRFPFFYKSFCSKVKGKAIRLKTDK